MILEHLDTTQTAEEVKAQVETPEAEAVETPVSPKKPRRWLIPALIAAVVVIAAAVIFVVSWPAPMPDPHEALSAALNGLAPLPNPVSLGVLGQGELGGARFGVSGNLNLQADEDGLAVLLSDFTLGYEDGALDLSVYINNEMAAATVPFLMGEMWYGVDFMEGLKVQAGEVVNEELLAWYFDDSQLEEARAVIDELRVQLGGIHEIGLDSVDVMRLDDLFRQLSGETERTESGYALHFTASPPQINTWLDPTGQYRIFTGQEELGQVVDITVYLDEQERFTGVDVLCDSFTCLFDLGDPNEPTPRLELNRGGGNSLELAFTVSEGEALTAPDYENAFSLLIPTEP